MNIENTFLSNDLTSWDNLYGRLAIKQKFPMTIGLIAAIIIILPSTLFATASGHSFVPTCIFR